jgi:hypothetical protein
MAPQGGIRAVFLVATMKSETRRWRLWLVPVCAAVLAGCSEQGDTLPRQTVSGTVTFEGKPLAKGVIQFYPEPPTRPGGVAASGTIEGGKFTVAQSEGPTPGDYKVAIFASSGERAQSDEAPGKGGALMKELIPPRYNQQSELTAEVKDGGKNVFDYKLKK